MDDELLRQRIKYLIENSGIVPPLNRPASNRGLWAACTIMIVLQVTEMTLHLLCRM